MKQKREEEWRRGAILCDVALFCWVSSTCRSILWSGSIRVTFVVFSDGVLGIVQVTFRLVREFGVSFPLNCIYQLVARSPSQVEA